MDFINKVTGGGSQSNNAQAQAAPQQKQSGGFMDKLHGMAGGGPESERKEDSIDKGMLMHT
jgi:hypothetical protein